MDRDVLIKKIIKLTDYKREDLEKKSDSELFDIYLYLEDMGLVDNFDDKKMGVNLMSEAVETLMNDGGLTEDEAIDLVEEEGMDYLFDE